jgi:hypothetical protein
MTPDRKRRGTHVAIAPAVGECDLVTDAENH